jgi:hypothetical protein
MPNNKKFKHETKNPLIPLPQFSEPNQRISLDLFGSLKHPKMKKNFMCIIDTFSKFAELIAIPDKCAETVANALFSKWLCRHGVPLEIVSDQSNEFSNEIVRKLLMLLQNQKDYYYPTPPSN